LIIPGKLQTTGSGDLEEVYQPLHSRQLHISQNQRKESQTRVLLERPLVISSEGRFLQFDQINKGHPESLSN
jgi:hypothetical protein